MFLAKKYNGLMKTYAALVELHLLECNFKIRLPMLQEGDFREPLSNRAR